MPIWIIKKKLQRGIADLARKIKGVPLAEPVSRMTVSLMLQAKKFQLFHLRAEPIHRFITQNLIATPSVERIKHTASAGQSSSSSRGAAEAGAGEEITPSGA